MAPFSFLSELSLQNFEANQNCILASPSTCTVNLHLAVLRAWSETLYRITCIPSGKSVPDSSPFRKTLVKDDKNAVYRLPLTQRKLDGFHKM